MNKLLIILLIIFSSCSPKITPDKCTLSKKQQYTDAIVKHNNNKKLQTGLVITGMFIYIKTMMIWTKP